MSQLSERGREIWEQISEGEEEAAARAFDRLGEEEQKALTRKLDVFDRKALRRGYEQAIERDGPGQARSEQARSRSQNEGQDKSSSHEGPTQSRGPGRVR